MKYILILALSFTISFNLSAQDYLDNIANQTCSCFQAKDTVDAQKLYLEVGICMIKASEPYKKQLKKDHNINFDNIDKEGEALGKLIGLRMASVCPDVLLKLNAASKKKTATPSGEIFTGRVSKIEKDFFVIFTISREGKTLKFYWLTNAESNIELINRYTELFDKDVNVEYTVNSLFDPKIGDYRNFNVILKIEQISR